MEQETQNRKKTWIIAIVVCALLVAGLYFAGARKQGTKPPSRTLRVVTTFLPIYSMTANVVGDLAEVTNLLPGGVGPHEYSFTPADIRTIANADVVVKNGLGLESWMEKIIAESGTKARVVDASVGVQAAEDFEEGVNPHIWLDPVRAQLMAQTIADGIAAADPAHAPRYRANARVFVARLRTLHGEYAEMTAAAAHPRYVSFHSALAYLAKRYGWNQVAVIEEFPGKEPSAQYLASVVRLVRQYAPIALFSEPQFSPKVLETVANETGAKIYEIDTMETGAFAPETYEAVMRKNLATFRAAFSQQ